MLEPWDELLNFRKERQLCADDVETIKATCAKDHGKPHVAHCPECWDRLLNRMRDRYLNSATKEWFSGRRIFLQELDTIFALKSNGDRPDFQAIEQRIGEEKKGWYRERVKNIGLQAAARTPSDTRLLQQKWNDDSITAEELAPELRGVIGIPSVSDRVALDDFLRRLGDAQSPQARSELYIDAFFQAGPDPKGGARRYEKYIEMIRSGTALTEVVNAMLRDRQAAQGEQNQKRELQGKFEELKRAKAAHELSLAKKQKARHDRATAAAAAAASEEQHRLPPCSVCSEALDAQDFLACPLCQLLHEQYGIGDRSVLYCSQRCQYDGYETHVNAAHSCAAGSHCTSLHDTDVEMDEAGRAPVFCRECVSRLALPSVFCTPRCYDANFQRHRDEVHLPEREKQHSQVDDASQLEFAAEDRAQYRARKIEEHFIPLEDALDEYQKRSGVAIS